LRPDFFDIYEPLTQMGLNLTVFTNATLMSPEIAACFARNPPNRLEVTVYGATRATYEAITGVPGSYDRCLTGIEMLLGTGITMALKITLTRDNLGELEAARRMAHERGLPLKVGWLLTHRRDGAASDVDEMRLPARDCIALEADDTEACRVWSELGPSPDGAHTGGLYCMAGKAAFFVGPTGEMGVCIDLQAPAVRPLQVGFLAAWEQVRQYAREVPPSAECATCSLQDYCPTCPARALLETGSLTGVDRYCCEIARARRDRFASGIQT
jgi:radical SAM protein with 4Fe4S-binding SPASM domain